MAKSKSSVRIVTLDIETAPLESFTWDIWDQNIGLNQIKSEWTILSFSAKWLDESKVIYADTGGRGVKKVRDDKALMKKLWAILDEADIVVAQNGKAFDLKKINARMLMHGMKPYSPVRIIDTKIVAKRHFKLTSNRLEWMSEYLTQTKKLKHKKFPGFELWLECLKDNPAAWKEMRAYNQVDVLATEELYLKLRPWIEGHANVSVYGSVDRPACPKCASRNVIRQGTAYTQNGSYPRFQCKDCGGWARGKAAPDTTRRRNLLSN